jgi:hypothetical protein
VSLPTIAADMKQLKEDLKIVEKNTSKMKKKKDQAVKFKGIMGVIQLYLLQKKLIQNSLLLVKLTKNFLLLKN